MKSGSTIADYQEYVRKMVLERGFEKETASEVFMLLVEEVGELAKSMRKQIGVKVDSKSSIGDVEDEIGDVFFLLVDLYNRLNINLEKAFLDKEAKNQKRLWK